MAQTVWWTQSGGSGKHAAAHASGGRDPLNDLSLRTGKLLLNSGTAAAPSYSFFDDQDSGIYRIGANNLALALNGTKVLDILTTGLGLTGNLTMDGGPTLNTQLTIGHLTSQGSAILSFYAGNTGAAFAAAAGTWTYTNPSAGTGKLVWNDRIASTYTNVLELTNGNMRLLVGTVATLKNITWDMGAYTADAVDRVSTGYVTVKVAGVDYKLMTRA